jgi:hypothetical protein
MTDRGSCDKSHGLRRGLRHLKPSHPSTACYPCATRRIMWLKPGNAFMKITYHGHSVFRIETGKL